MAKNTKNKILDAALKIFARDGYNSATTRSIAQESGFSEITLFRKFETKEKLFQEAMTCNHVQLQESCLSVINDLDQKFEDPKEFMEVYISRMEFFFKTNFQFFNLMVTEDNLHIDDDMGEFGKFMGKFIERNINNNELNAETLAITINTYLYMLNIGLKKGYPENEVEDMVQKFTKNILNCF